MLFNPNKGVFQSSSVAKIDGENVRVSVYKNMQTEKETKEYEGVTEESINAEIAKIDAQISKLQEQKNKKEIELDQLA